MIHLNITSFQSTLASAYLDIIRSIAHVQNVRLAVLLVDKMLNIVLHAFLLNIDSYNIKDVIAFKVIFSLNQVFIANNALTYVKIVL